MLLEQIIGLILMSQKPNLFVIGAPKCGTTHVVAALSEHPECFLPYPKETGFWATDVLRPKSVSDIKTLAQYEALYDSATPYHSYRIDGSVIYLFSSTAVENILKFNEEAKFVVMLRNPVEQVQSWHQEQVFNFNEDVKDFWTAWSLQSERARGRHLPPHLTEPARIQYAHYCALGDQLERAVKKIPARNLFIGFLEDIKNNPGAFYRSLQAFLGVQIHEIGIGGTVKPARRHRFSGLAQYYQEPPTALAPAVRLIKRFLRQPNSKVLPLLKLALTQRTVRNSLSKQHENELHAVFDAQTEKIEALTQRDLAHWKRT